MARNFINYVNYSYSGGMNDFDEQDNLQPDQGVLIQNAYIHKPGALEKRSGISQLGNDIGDTRILGGTGWKENDGTKWQLVMATTTLYWLNSATWTAVDSGFTTGLDTEFVPANNKMYIFNGTDNIHSFDGTSAGSVGSASFTGTGLDDATFGGTYTGGGQTYQVKIDATGTPDTFTWSDDGGSTFQASGVAITGSAQTLSNGVTVTFGATTGHTTNDLWDSVCTSALTDLGASIPTGKYAAWWRNYMFLCGSASLSGTTYPSRVYFSNLGDPDTWTTGTDYFDVGLDDGQEITGIYALESFLIIFKRRSVYILTGSGPADWRLSGTVNNLNNVSGTIGCVSHRSIVQVGNDVWFMSDDGIRSLRRNEEGTTPLMGVVSRNIQDTIDNLNKGQLSRVCGILYNKRVYYAMPSASSSTNDIVMVAETRLNTENPFNPHPWVKYTGWSPSVFWVHIPSSQINLYMGEDTGDSLVYQAETGTNDNSSAIDFDYKGPMIDLRQPDMRKTTRFIIASAESGGNYDVDVSTSDNGSTYTVHGQINLSSGDLWNTGVWDTATWGYGAEIKEKFAIGRASTQIQVRFRNNQADQGVKMYPYTLAIKPKKVK